MGEEVKQEQEQPKVEFHEKAEAGKAEDASKPPPTPVILFVDLHCGGCAKKIERSIMRIKGVEGVLIDMAQNQVTVRGGQLDPQAICDRITKKTRRRAKVLSPLPLPTPTPDSQQPPTPAVVEPPLSTPTTRTVELNVNMQCEACAGKLKRKILRMEGVENVETELGSGKVTVTGTMDTAKLVDYVYRCTKKHAQIVQQPKPEPEGKNPEGGGDQVKKGEGKEKPAEDTGQGKEEEKREKDNKDDDAKEEDKKKKEDENKEKEEEVVELDGEDVMKRMMVNYYQYQQQPLYVMERLPPPPAPQLFSDENPNACSIS